MDVRTARVPRVPGCGRLLYTRSMPPAAIHQAVELVEVEILLRQGWLVHGFSTRAGGMSTAYGRPDDLNLGFTAHDPRDTVETNRRRLVERIGSATRLITVRQVHAAEVLRVTSAGLATDAEADGLITDEPGLLLGIQTADCVPILIADPEHRAVGAFHAGWRGTAARIVEAGVARMAAEFGSDPEKLLAAIGPSIGRCCYQVGEEVAAIFTADFEYGRALLAGERNLDLKRANGRQLLAAGLRGENISMSDDCTSCQPAKYFSHRAQAGVTGRMLAVIGARTL